MTSDDPYSDDELFAPDPGQPSDPFPGADEIPESSPDMWNPAPGEVPGTGGMLFPDTPVEPPADQPWNSSQGPPPGFTPQEYDAYGNSVLEAPPGVPPDDFPPIPEPPEGFTPQEYDAYGNPVLEAPPGVPPDDFPPIPDPPPGFEVIDEYGNPTGYDAYGNPVTQP